AVQLGPELEPLERLLRESLQLVRTVHRPTPPAAAPARAPPRPPSRARRARRAARSRAPASPTRPARAARAPRAPPRAASTAPPPSSTNRRRSPVRLLAHDPTEDPVDELRCVHGRIPLRERDRLVEDDLHRHLALVELLERDAEDVALDRAEPVGGPVDGRLGDPRVELVRARGDGLREALRVRVDVTLVERTEGLAGDVPLEEDEDGRAARLPAADGAHRTSSTTLTSTAATSTPHMRASASPTRSCTARATSGRKAPYATATSSSALAWPSTSSSSSRRRAFRSRAPATEETSTPTICASAASLTRTEPPAAFVRTRVTSRRGWADPRPLRRGRTSSTRRSGMHRSRGSPRARPSSSR